MSQLKNDWKHLQPLERILIRLVLLGYVTIIIVGLCGVLAK